MLHKLIACSGSGGNLLLNVGPKPDGTIPEESVTIIKKVGEWLKKNDEFLANSERSDFERLWNNSLLVTVKGEKLYLHFFAPPVEDNFCYAEIKSKVRKVYMLDGKVNIDFRQEGDRLFLLDVNKNMKDDLVNTVVIETKGKPTPVNAK